MIAAEAPGMGDPRDLTPAVWDALLIRICEQKAISSGDTDARQGATLAKIKRDKRKREQWQKHSAKQM